MYVSRRDGREQETHELVAFFCFFFLASAQQSEDKKISLASSSAIKFSSPSRGCVSMARRENTFPLCLVFALQSVVGPAASVALTKGKAGGFDE